MTTLSIELSPLTLEEAGTRTGNWWFSMFTPMIGMQYLFKMRDRDFSLLIFLRQSPHCCAEFLIFLRQSL